MRRDHHTVYFLQKADGGPIKIGHTRRSAKVRRGEAQTDNADELVVVAEAAGVGAEEKALHRHFRAARVRREWFAPTRELMELIDALHEGVRLRDWLEGC